MSTPATTHEEFLSLLTRCSPDEKGQMLAELARQLFGQQPHAVSLAIVDPTGLIGYLTKPNVSQPAYDPAKEDPVFWAEILRRVANPEPCLTKEEVTDLFGLNPLDEDDFRGNEGKGAA